jgi:hypothetical protein
MLTVGTAQELRAAGLAWTPQALDFFAIPVAGLENQVFVISDMTILAEALHGQPAITFHGSVEWSLDHVWVGEALWLPREDQLRALVQAELAKRGDWRLRLEVDAGGCRCLIDVGGATAGFAGQDASECLAAALLALLREEQR